MVNITREPRAAKSISMTPLIDIVFQLLIFFMVTTSFMRQESLEMVLPSKELAQKKAAKGEVVRVELASGHRYGLEGTWMGEDELLGKLRASFAKNTQMPALIQTYPDVSMGELVEVMDMIYLSGGNQVAVVRTGQALMPAPVQQMPQQEGRDD